MKEWQRKLLRVSRGCSGRVNSRIWLSCLTPKHFLNCGKRAQKSWNAKIFVLQCHLVTYWIHSKTDSVPVQRRSHHFQLLEYFIPFSEVKKKQKQKQPLSVIWKSSCLFFIASLTQLLFLGWEWKSRFCPNPQIWLLYRYALEKNIIGIRVI